MSIDIGLCGRRLYIRVQSHSKLDLQTYQRILQIGILRYLLFCWILRSGQCLAWYMVSAGCVCISRYIYVTSDLHYNLHLTNVWIFSDNLILSYWLTHVIPFLILAALKCSNSILVRGVYLDADGSGEECVEIPIHYVRLHFERERKKRTNSVYSQKPSNLLLKSSNDKESQRVLIEKPMKPEIKIQSGMDATQLVWYTVPTLRHTHTYTQTHYQQNIPTSISRPVSLTRPNIINKIKSKLFKRQKNYTIPLQTFPFSVFDRHYIKISHK